MKNETINKFKKAFSILEVLMVIALIGLIAGLFAVNFDVLLKAIGKKRPEKILYNAICEARYQTVQEHAPVYLSFDEKQHELIVFKEQMTQPLGQFKLEKDINVIFETIPPNKYSGAQFKSPPISTVEKIENIAFFPDGSSTPVTITLVENREPYKLKPDILSCGIRAI